MTLQLAEANRIIQAAIGKAEELDFKVCVAVLDAGGRLVAFARMDEAVWAGVYGAIGKAVAASAFGNPTEGVEKIAEAPVVKGIVATEGGNMITASGAVPIKREGVVIGACGVGGARGTGDHDIATAGVAAL